MRRVIRKEILGKSYHQYHFKHDDVNVKKREKKQKCLNIKSDPQEEVYEEENTDSENELTNEDSKSDFSSEVTLSTSHGKEDIVIHTDKEIIGESVEIKHGTSVRKLISEDTKNVPFYFLQTRLTSKRSWEPELGNLVTHDKFMYFINRINKDGSVRWCCRMEGAPFHCRGSATTYKDISGEINVNNFYNDSLIKIIRKSLPETCILS